MSAARPSFTTVFFIFVTDLAILVAMRGNEEEPRTLGQLEKKGGRGREAELSVQSRRRATPTAMLEAEGLHGTRPVR